jgi:hypothetical protein
VGGSCVQIKSQRGSHTSRPVSRSTTAAAAAAAAAAATVVVSASTGVTTAQRSGAAHAGRHSVLAISVVAVAGVADGRRRNTSVAIATASCTRLCRVDVTCSPTL